MSHESCSTLCKRHSRLSAAVGVGADLVTTSSAVHNLGIAIDDDVTMQTHLSKTVSVWFAVLRQLRSIRRLVSETVFKSLVVSLFMPCLDYGNTTLAGLPAYEHERHLCSISLHLLVTPQITLVCTVIPGWQLLTLTSSAYTGQSDSRLAVFNHRWL